MIWFALVLGVTFGVVATLRHFCLHGSLLENFTHKRANTGRLTSFIIAMLCAMLFVQGVHAVFPLRLDESIYLSAQLNIIALVVGGFLFGVGMMLSQGCVSRHIIKLASGNLMSLPTLLLIGVFAFAAIAGAFAVPLNWLQENASVQLAVPQSIPALLHQYVGLSMTLATLLALVCYVLVLLAFAWCVRQKGQPIWYYWDGFVMALIITLGWLGSTIGYDEFDDIPLASQSLTFTLPVARTMQYIMLSTSYAFDFTIAVVCGAFAGAFFTNLIRRSFRLVTFIDTKETAHALIGACLMGLGGVMAIGCNVGQGLSGMSTLSLGSIIALVSILAGSGCVIAVRDRSVFRGGVSAAIASSQRTTC